MSVRAIILAAGKGTRMRSDIPKVLHPVAGRPMISWVVDAVLSAGVDDITVIVGHGADAVTAVLPDGVRSIIQEQQSGTGHAARVATAAMGDLSGATMLIVPGDSPLMTADTLRSLLAAHASGDAGCTVLTTRMPDPTGYGRVVRDGDAVDGIVEERDADEATRAIQEVAVSTYVFDGEALTAALGGLKDDNEQGEYYLTDAVGLLAGLGRVGALSTPDHTETLGVNSHEQLSAVDAAMRARINRAWMAAGVRMLDPSRVYVEAGVTLVGPSHAGVAERAGSMVPGLSAEGYLRESIINPDAHVLEGFFPGIMYQEFGEDLSEQEINDLVAFMLTLK